MSQPRLPRNDHYRALTAELRREGLVFRERSGGKHGKIIVDVNGREETVIVSTSPSDHRSAANAVSYLRRRIRMWKQEMSAEIDQ